MSLTESVRYLIDAEDLATAKIRKHEGVLRKFDRETKKRSDRAARNAQSIIGSTKTELERIKDKIKAVQSYARTSSKAAAESQEAISRLIALHKEEVAAIKEKEQQAIESIENEAAAALDKAKLTALGIGVVVAGIAVEFRKSFTIDFNAIEAARMQSELNAKLKERNEINKKDIEAAKDRKTFDAELSELEQLLAKQNERTEALKKFRKEEVPKNVGNSVLPGVTKGVNDFQTLDTAAGREVKQSLDATKELTAQIERLKKSQTGALDAFNDQLEISKLRLTGNTDEARRLELQHKKTFSAEQIKDVIAGEKELEALRKKQVETERKRAEAEAGTARFESSSAVLALQLAEIKGNEKLIDQLTRRADIASGLTPVQAELLAQQRKQVELAKEQADDAEKATAKRLAAEKKIAGVYDMNIKSLKEQLIGVTKSKEAAAAFKLEMQGVNAQDAEFLGGLKVQIEKLGKAKSTINVGKNDAKDDRLLNGRAQASFAKTAEAIEAERQTKIQTQMKTALDKLVEFERNRKNQPPLQAVGR